MAIAEHVEQLRKRHEDLSKQVETIQRSPGATDAEIVALKKQKLKIKEEITRLT